MFDFVSYLDTIPTPTSNLGRVHQTTGYKIINNFLVRKTVGFQYLCSVEISRSKIEVGCFRKLSKKLIITSIEKSKCYQ